MFCTIRYRCMDEVERREGQAAGLPLLLTRESSPLRVASPSGQGSEGVDWGGAEMPTAARPPAYHWDAGGMRQDSRESRGGRIMERTSLARASWPCEKGC
jgi:hypothetical protein